MFVYNPSLFISDMIYFRKRRLFMVAFIRLTRMKNCYGDGNL